MNDKIIVIIVSWILTAILWGLVWIETGLHFYEWKFWVVLFAIIGLTVMSDVRRNI